MAKLKPEDFSKIVFVSAPNIGIHGKILFLRTTTDLDKNIYVSQLWIYDNGALYPLTKGPSDKYGKWSPSGDLVAFINNQRPGKPPNEKEKGSGLWLIRTKGEPWFLHWFPNGVSSFHWFSDSRRILVLSNRGKIDENVKIIDTMPIWYNGVGWVYGFQGWVYVVEVDNGEIWEPEISIGKEQDIVYATPSPDGRKIAYVLRIDRRKPILHEIHVFDLGSSEDYTVIKEPMRVIKIVWSPDGKYLVFKGNRLPRGLASNHRLWIIDSSQRGQEPILVNDFDRNHANNMNCDSRGFGHGNDLHWDIDNYIYYLAAWGGEVRLYRIKPFSNEPELLVSGGVVDEFSVYNGKVAYTYMTSSHPNELYLLENSKQEKLTGFNDGLVERWGLKKPEKIVFKASDGVLVEGWILRSYNGEGKKPTILEIHGGPKTAYGEGFMFEFHLLASNGYNVIYSNPRGSDGYSEEFADIRGRYGERDYLDLMGFVDEIMKRYGDEIDEEKLGVTGGSYGGFMTNWIVGHTNRFKAAVTQRSISNWFISFGATDIGYYFDADQIGGLPWDIPEKFLEKSPLSYVKNIETPLLIIHSLEDYRCHVAEATSLYTALKLLGRETRLILFPEENHDLSRRGKPKHRVERLKHILEWFNKYLKDGKENKI